MNSNSDSINSLHPHSLKLESISLNNYKKKPKFTKGIFKKNNLYEYQRKKGDIKYLEKYIHKYFISFYKSSKNDYNIRMIEDILNNETTHLVAEFKDYLIMGDITEFLQKSYNIEECRNYLPKIYEYYNCCSVIFPNYVKLHESKYIYKNIRKKQKVIDNQQEQEEKLEKIKKGEIKYDENEHFLTTRTLYSILNQSNTTNIKLFFGINDKVDINETPNNIIEKLKKAEKEVIKKKIQLMKNSSKLNIKENNNTFQNLNTSNINKRNNSKIFKKNKKINERNKNYNDFHYLSHVQKKKIHKKNLSNINIKMNINNSKKKKIKINNYLTKGNESKKYIKPSSSINDTENDLKKKKNYITFYGNNLINSKKKEIKKLIYENISIKHHNIFIRSRNNSNKIIQQKFINSLLPNKAILSRLFSNFNNSILTHNSYIRKKLLKNQIAKENKKKIGSASPISTIQVNSFRKKHKYHINMNLKESQSSRNINNYKFNLINKSKELINLKNISQKKNRNIKNNINYKFSDNNCKTLPTSTNPKIKTSREKIKKFHKNIKNKSKNVNNFSHFKTIVYNTLNNSKKNIKSNSNSNHANNSNNQNKINSNNMQKINSTTNIKSRIDVNANTNNNNINKINLKEATCTNVLDSKIFSKSPFNLELETIRVTKRKRILYPKKKTYSDFSNKKINNKNSQSSKNNNNIPNKKNSNTISKDKNNYLDSLVHTSSNSNNINDEFINNGLGTSSTINNINIKKEIILEELSKKKNIILPIKKEINNIDINIKGYNNNRGTLTSRGCNNINKKKCKKNINIKETNYFHNDNKIINKNKKQNNLMDKIEGNPVKIKTIYDNIKNNHINTNKSLGNRTTKKK